MARATPWGAPDFDFKLAAVYSKGVQIGWGATCALHTNADDVPGVSPACKKQLVYGAEGLSDSECRVRLKLWLLAGLSIDLDSGSGRKDHVALNARTMVDETDEERVDMMLPAAELALRAQGRPS